MREFLVEIALRKADSIKNKISEYGLDDVLEQVSKLWINYNPSREELESFAGVDGSNNSIDFKGLTLYAVIGYGVAKESTGVKTYLVGDIDILYTSDTSEHIRLLREIAEIKTAYLASNVELLMVDGSITSLLIRPRPLTDNVALSTTIKQVLEINQNIFIELWDLLKKQLSSADNKLFEPYVSHQLASKYKLYGKNTMYLIVLLEYIEKLLSIRLLLDKTIIKKKKPSIVFISKTSRSRDYCEKYFVEYEEKLGRQLPPDILLFTYSTREIGYSKPLLTRIDKGFPSEGDLKKLIYEFFRGISYVITYARFSQDSPVFKLEIPVYTGVHDIDPDDLVHSIMENIHPIIVDGYPYPLIEADKMSRITRNDIIDLAQIMGFLPRQTGREVLVEWL